MHHLTALEPFCPTACRQEQPVGFVSRILTPAEKSYSQIEKERLAYVFAVKIFHEYLCGHPFILQTDYKPLLSLFNENKAVPPQAAGRIQRWALTLAAYQYTIQCCSTAQHTNADPLSRLLIGGVSEKKTPIPELVLMIENLMDAPLIPHQIALWTTRDPFLSRVFWYPQEGWPQQGLEKDLKPFWQHFTELSTHEGCIL